MNEVMMAGLCMGWVLGYLCGWFVTLLDQYIEIKLNAKGGQDGNK